MAKGYDPYGHEVLGVRKTTDQLFVEPLPPTKSRSTFSIFCISLIFYFYFLKLSLYRFWWAGKPLINFLLTPTPPSPPPKLRSTFSIFVISLICYYIFFKPSMYRFWGSEKPLVNFLLTLDPPTPRQN